jgi:stage V sporulation protein S
MSESNVIVLRIKNSTPPAKLAGSIAKNLQEGKAVTMIAVGAGAVNQCIKGFSIARGFTAASGLNLAIIPSFEDIEINSEHRTAIKFQILDLSRYLS